MTIASPLAEGQLLAGKYRGERVLGQGGMGVVIAARHIHLEERVAIKLMLAEAAINQEAVARFVREARAAARLESAHVAKVSDVGTLEDGRPYMVMEYVDGADLSQVLQSPGPLPLQDAVDYLLQAGEAVAEAHSLGIVHRDLKPANLFLTRRRDRTAKRAKGWLVGVATALCALGAAGRWLAKPQADAIPLAASASGAPRAKPRSPPGVAARSTAPVKPAAPSSPSLPTAQPTAATPTLAPAAAQPAGKTAAEPKKPASAMGGRL